jgi:hypothetical protein
MFDGDIRDPVVAFREDAFNTSGSLSRPASTEHAKPAAWEPRLPASKVALYKATFEDPSRRPLFEDNLFSQGSFAKTTNVHAVNATDVDFAFVVSRSTTGTVPGPPDISQDIERLAAETASENWNFERDVPIKRETWTRAQQIAVTTMLRAPALGKPGISPCGDGTVHLTWHGSAKTRVVLEVGEDKIDLHWRDQLGNFGTLLRVPPESAVAELTGHLR